MQKLHVAVAQERASHVGMDVQSFLLELSRGPKDRAGRDDRQPAAGLSRRCWAQCR